MPSPRYKRSIPARYAAGLGAAGLALLLRASLTPLIGVRFPLIFVSVSAIFVARYFGVGPAVVGAISGTVGAEVLFGRVPLSPSANSAGLVVFFGGTCVAIVFVDIVRRARASAEERLEQLKEETGRLAREEQVSNRLRAIVESSEDAIASVDLSGAVTSWNRAAERIFGYPIEEALGRPITMLTPSDRSQEEAEMLALIHRGERAKPCETIRFRKDGDSIDVSLTISPIHDCNGALAGASYIAHEITERKQFEQRLLQAQKTESLGVLAGGLAHDFNNLLTDIMGNATLALRTLPKPEAKERIQEVLLASERAAGLVSQMLAYAGKGAFVVDRLDLSRVIEDIRPLIRTSIAPQIALGCHLESKLPLVEGDRAQIQQVVMNLALNAAEAIGESAGTVSISTAAVAEEGAQRVVLEVRDDGSGMDEAVQARIFDPFFTTRFTGRGLGLAAARGIILAHRGEIFVESAPGQGSTFRVVFPIAEAAAAEKA